MDEGDASVDRSPSARVYGRSEHLDRSTVGFDDPGHDAHQGRFPGTVLANDRVNFTGRDLQRNVVHGQGAAESLGDAGGGNSDVGRTRGGHTRLQSVHKGKQITRTYVPRPTPINQDHANFPKTLSST